MDIAKESSLIKPGLPGTGGAKADCNGIPFIVVSGQEECRVHHFRILYPNVA